MVCAVVFDFDGVILETELPQYLAWREIWSEFGHDLPLEVWATGVGTYQNPGAFDPFRDLVRRTGLDSDRRKHRGSGRSIERPAPRNIGPSCGRCGLDYRGRGHGTWGRCSV